MCIKYNVVILYIMATKNRRNRNLRKNNKSRRRSREKRGVARGNFDDENLSKAYRTIYEKNGDANGPPTSYWLKEYLTDQAGSESDDYKKVEKINHMLITGYKMMQEGFDEFEELMQSE